MADTSKSIRLIDKPSGITSFDIIRRLRKKEGIQKAGHAGTLDPAASGLMIIGVGKEGTKQLTQLTKLDKTYEATIELGVRTDTGDRDGEVIEDVVVEKPPEEAEIQRVTRNLIGTVRLPVPAYSAVKVDGEPLYKKARRGEEVEPPVRTMTIHNIELKNAYTKDGRAYLDITMDVASGVFVRSVVEEIGRRLGYPATTAALRRTQVGKFRVEDAEQLD